jgi:hypothetical protein
VVALHAASCATSGLANHLCDMSNGVAHCKYCSNLTLETLSQGYLHAPKRSSLVSSAQTCRFCSLLFRKDRSRDGGQLYLKLEPFSGHDRQLCLRISHLQNEKNGQLTEPLSFFLHTSLGKFYPPFSFEAPGTIKPRLTGTAPLGQRDGLLRSWLKSSH